MNTKGKWGMLTIAVLAAGSLAAYAEPGLQCGEGNRPHGGSGFGSMAMGGEHHGKMGYPPPGLNLEQAKKAGATDAQIQTMTDFQLEQQIKRIDLHATAEKAELKLGALLKSQNPDEKTILQAADTVSQARGELFKLEVTTMLKAKQVLGETVLQKLHEMGPPAPPAEARNHGPRGGNKRSAALPEEHGPASAVK